jgi:hypothetical protein
MILIAAAGYTLWQPLKILAWCWPMAYSSVSSDDIEASAPCMSLRTTWTMRAETTM